MRWSVVTRKNDESAIVSHAHHEQVRVVGDQHQRHRGEEHVVLEADEARRRAFAGAEIAGREQRDRRAGGAQQQQEERGQRVERADGTAGRAARAAAPSICGSGPIAKKRDDREREADGGAGGKQRVADEAQIARAHEPQRADREPRPDGGDDSASAFAVIADDRRQRCARAARGRAQTVI